MGARYLTDLAAVCRAAGLLVQEEPGWQTRSRSSGGYNSGLPNHVMLHHTASGAASDGQPDVNYMCYSSDSRPIANLYLSRSGKVWVMAAGATNTNGSGSAPWGGCPNDSMNTHAIGIEAGNNGTGEPWPDPQQRAYVVLARALKDAYGINTGFHRSHAEWAVGRKIDPAGPSRWAGSGTWNEDAFRGDLATGWPGAAPTPVPPPTRGTFPGVWDTEGDEPMFIAVNAGKYYLVTTRGLVWLKHPDTINGHKAAGLAQVAYDDGSFQELERVMADAP